MTATYNMLFRRILKYCMQKNCKITVTPLEREIFDMVLECRRAHQLKTVIRVAGGWVRDKLMNKDSNDIDLTLDDMKGEQFALLFRQYFTGKDEKVSGFGVTRLNPEMSKHLETAKIFVKGLEIDIVNLRSEKYAEDTRIPQIEIGTPKEDAERRDLTINSMFYNLVTGEVEDWTERGLKDLENGIICTPLEPYVTFKDDPLRILRCFRFAGRFGFKVVPEIFEAVLKPDIRNALRTKVSKERVGKQIASMLKAQDPMTSLRYIQETKIWDVVFEVPESSNLKDQTMMPKVSLLMFERMQSLLKEVKLEQLPVLSKILVVSAEDHQENGQAKTWTLEEIRIALLLTALTCVYQPFTATVNKRKEPLIRYVIRDSLKLPNKQSDFAVRVSDGAKSLRYITRTVFDPQSIEQLPEEVRHATLVRWIRSTGEVWQCSLLLARCSNIEPAEQERLAQLSSRIQKLNIRESHLATGHINGDDVTKMGIKGPGIRIVLDNAAVWRLLHQDKTEADFKQELSADLKRFQDPEYLRPPSKQQEKYELSGFAW